MRRNEDRKRAHRAADRGDGGAEIAPVLVQHPPSRTSPVSRASPGICDGGQANPASRARSTSSLHVAESRKTLETPSAEGSLRSRRPAWGRGLLGPSQLSHGGLTVVSHRAAHHTSHASWPGYCTVNTD